MGTRFSWAYLIRCDATDYIYPSPTKPKNQVRTTPLPNVIRQHAARSGNSPNSDSCHWNDSLTMKAAVQAMHRALYNLRVLPPSAGTASSKEL